MNKRNLFYTSNSANLLSRCFKLVTNYFKIFKSMMCVDQLYSIWMFYCSRIGLLSCFFGNPIYHFITKNNEQQNQFWIWLYEKIKGFFWAMMFYQRKFLYFVFEVHILSQCPPGRHLVILYLIRLLAQRHAALFCVDKVLTRLIYFLNTF